jgi:hypothetical protein
MLLRILSFMDSLVEHTECMFFINLIDLLERPLEKLEYILSSDRKEHKILKRNLKHMKIYYDCGSDYMFK